MSSWLCLKLRNCNLRIGSSSSRGERQKKLELWTKWWQTLTQMSKIMSKKLNSWQILLKNTKYYGKLLKSFKIKSEKVLSANHLHSANWQRPRIRKIPIFSLKLLKNTVENSINKMFKKKQKEKRASCRKSLDHTFGNFSRPANQQKQPSYVDILIFSNNHPGCRTPPHFHPFFHWPWVRTPRRGSPWLDGSVDVLRSGFDLWPGRCHLSWRISQLIPCDNHRK